MTTNTSDDLLPVTQVYEARVVVGGMPTDCCDYGVISHATGKEVCRVWLEEDARKIAELLNAQAAFHPTVHGVGREALEQFPMGKSDVLSRFVLVHQLRASANIQDRETKHKTGWADTSDRATLMRKAADTIERLALIASPTPDDGGEPDRLADHDPDYWTESKADDGGEI